MLLNRISLTLAAVCAAISLSWINSVADEKDFLTEILRQIDGEGLPHRSKLVDDCQLRIVYVQIDRNKNQDPKLKYFTLGLERNDYFYPASLVKLPVSFMALERVNELKKSYVPWLDKTTKLEIIQAEDCQSSLYNDSTTKEGHANLAGFIRRILTASDNPSYNRLYDFLGQEVIRDKLRAKGFNKTRIPIRFSDCDREQNRYSPYIRFSDVQSGLTFNLPARFNADTAYLYSKNRKAGKAYVEKNKTIWRAKDFSQSNELPLQEAVEMMVRFVVPENVSKEKRWNLTETDRQFLWQYFATYPYKSRLPEYQDSVKFPRHLKKYFLHDAKAKLKWSESIKVFNIVGMAYGFVTDVSYVVDLETGVEFILAASVIANENGIIGDGRYNYEKLAFPLFGRLFNKIYDHELNRKREHKSDFKEIREALSKPMM
jgi:hypothetical protein